MARDRPFPAEAAGLSLVIPCYNEEELLEHTVHQLLDAFQHGGRPVQLILVDNGSTDGTDGVIRQLAADLPSIAHVRVLRNVGYGHGILEGLKGCRSEWVGWIPADGQVDAADVVKLYEMLLGVRGLCLGKVRRRFRMDGPVRKTVSVCYNLFARMLWPRLNSIDINGTPKILPRRVLEQMQLSSTGWLLDVEAMIKAHYMGVRILEMNVFGRMRSGGASHVSVRAVWDFVVCLLAFRFSGTLASWKARRPS